jgi:hypothetical protein
VSDLLEVWREAERTTTAARSALGPAKRAADASKKAADMVAETARSAELTVESAERSRDIALDAAREATAAAGIALDDHATGEGALSDANAAVDRARERYQDADKAARKRHGLIKES